EDGRRDFHVTRVQTCALPIYSPYHQRNGFIEIAGPSNRCEDEACSHQGSDGHTGNRIVAAAHKSDDAARHGDKEESEYYYQDAHQKTLGKTFAWYHR